MAGKGWAASVLVAAVMSLAAIAPPNDVNALPASAPSGADWLPYHRSDFLNWSDPGWTVRARGGRVSLSNSWAVLETPWWTGQFPEVLRGNGDTGDGGRLIPAAGNFRLAIRFQYGFPSGVSNFGTDIWAGTRACGTSSPLCRHVNVYMHPALGFRLRLLPSDWGDEITLGPVDSAVHILEVTKVGNVWTAWVDGVQRMQRINRGTHPERPDLVYAGDPTTQWWAGIYPTIRLDSVVAETDASACITGVSPAAPQAEGTNVSITARGVDGLGIGVLRFMLNATTDGSAGGAWWTFAAAAGGGGLDVTRTVTLDWAQAPAGFPRSGRHRLAVEMYDTMGALRRAHDWNTCAWRTYTWIAQPTETPTPAPTFTPSPVPLTLSLLPEHARLVAYAPLVGQPAQTLRGSVAGGSGPPYGITIQVDTPNGYQMFFNLMTDASGAFVLTPELARDANFGTTVNGTWRAVARTAGAQSAAVVWDVDWYPVHITK